MSLRALLLLIPALTPAAQFSNIYNFAGPPGDGDYPFTGLLTGSDGVLYGVASGGTRNLGIAFTLSPPSSPGGAWTETILHDFRGPDGASPATALVMDSQGVLYGATAQGGTGACFGGCGAIFALKSTPTGWKETVLYSFTGGADGASPTGLTLAANGVLYGTTNNIASGGVGSVFSLAPPSAAVRQPCPSPREKC